MGLLDKILGNDVSTSLQTAVSADLYVTLRRLASRMKSELAGKSKAKKDEVKRRYSLAAATEMEDIRVKFGLTGGQLLKLARCPMEEFTEAAKD